MSTSGSDPDFEHELAKEREIVFEKLSAIFGPEIANDYVSPKTNETRQQLSLEELRLQGEKFKQSPSRIVIYTAEKASYHSFVRDQVAQQSPRYELERYVRNSSDIDAAKRYVNMANDLLINPQQSLLLFRSSKLNEQKANLFKSSNDTHSLQRVNHDPSIQKYFPETLSTVSKEHHEGNEEEFFSHSRDFSRCPSMHLQHNEKKYHVQFAKDFDVPNGSRLSTHNRHGLPTERSTSKNLEAFFSKENSTIQGRSSEGLTSDIHREMFPPLTISALKEYRPSVTPKMAPGRNTSSNNLRPIQQRKAMRRNDFLWNQSMVSSTKQP